MSGRIVLSVALAALLVLPVYTQTIPDEQSRRRALEQYRAGQEYMSAERFEQAADAFSKAIEFDPLLSIAHYQLGQADMNLRRYASAVVAYKGCIDAMSALHSLSQSNKFEVDKQREEEIRELRVQVNNTSLKIDPLKRTVIEQRLHDLEQQRTTYNGPFRPPAFALLALGSAYFRSGNLEAAELEWKAATEADRKYGEAHNNLAALYAMTGRKREAEAAMREAEKAGFRVNPQLKEDIQKMTVR
jgi:tetratricopeptide (TPR) repeat protein